MLIHRDEPAPAQPAAPTPPDAPLSPMDGCIDMALSLHATAAAVQLIEQLRQRHGAIQFHLSHGCCDGTTPMCLTVAELTPGADDVQVAQVVGVPFWMGRHQIETLAHLALTLDVAEGSNGAFSLEDGTGQRFVLKMQPLGARAD